MNKKQFLILVVLVVVLGAWGLSRWRTQSSAFSGGGGVAGQKLLGEFDVNAVAQLAIKHGTNELLLAKKDDTWRVAQRNDYPANFGEISADDAIAKHIENCCPHQGPIRSFFQCEDLVERGRAPSF